MRLVGYFLVVLAALFVLRALPVVGVLFRVPLFGFLLAAAVVGIVAERVGRALTHRRRFEAMRRDLGAVDTPHNRGKLGSLLLTQGRHREAVPHLEAAVEGEPDSAEWRYRLGSALLGAGRPADAAGELARAVELDPDHAYGNAQLRLAEAWLAADEPARSLEAVERVEQSHGPTPESAYRRGRALKALGRSEDARRAFEDVRRAAAQVAAYQRGEARAWVLRAGVARLLG